MSSIDQKTLKKIAELAKFVEDNEKISLPLFSIKLVKAQERYPNDHTIGMVSTIVNRMSNSSKLVIARAEVKDLYEKFYSKNTKFAQVFAEEMGTVEETVSAKPVEQQLVPLNTSDYMREASDPLLLTSLENAFNPEAQIRDYNDKLAGKSADMCSQIIQSFGFRNTASTVCGGQGILICAVSFDTPRGSTSVYIPVETDGSRVFAPSCFVSNAGSQELTKDNVFNYLSSKAGQKLQIKAEDVLKASLSVKGGEEISDVDLAVIKMQHAQDGEQLVGQQILGVSMPEVNPNLVWNDPNLETKEFATVASVFDTAIGLATSRFGKTAVHQGHSMITGVLKSAGFPAHTVAVDAVDADSIMYSVALNGGSIAFKIPVKVEAKCALPPSILLCNGSMKSFDKSSIAELVSENNFDRTAAVSASPLYGMKGSELVNVVRAAVKEENYAKAEDALNILANSEDDKAFDVAMAAFKAGLNKTASVEEPVSKCAMVVRHNHSSQDLCGHTGLPLNKTYQDKHGQCHPLYRKNMAESYEGFNFMANKIYL